MGELTGKIEIDERGDADDARLSLRLARGRHRPPRRGARLRARARADRAPGGRRVRRRLAWPTRARSTLGDVERALAALGEEVAEGSVGRRHRDDVLRLPGRDRHRLAGRSASTTSACCCSATSATASASTCSGPVSSRRRSGAAPAGSCIAVCATDAPLAAAPAAAPGAAAAARPRPGRLLRLRRARARSGSRSRPATAGEVSRTTSSTRTSPPPGRRRRRRSTTASSPPARRSCATARCRRRFPVEQVRRLARARDERRLSSATRSSGSPGS